MIIHKGYNDLDLKDPVVSMGIFDGVHRGHQALISRLMSRARQTGGESVLITYHPHPRLVLEKGSESISFLTAPEEKNSLLEAMGVEHLVVVKFDIRLSRMKAEDFLRNILSERIGTKYLILGHDHHFGYGGGGDYETIIKCTGSKDLIIEQVDSLNDGDTVISSSLIREALMDGKLEEANRWLGYCYFLKGKVIKGEMIGRRLGFPTANIEPAYKYKLVPADGVYAVEVKLEGITMKAMLSIGFNPTVRKEKGKRSIEVHIFNFDKDIYRQDIEIIFRYRLRDEIRFSDPRQLAAQMQLDKANAIRLMA